MTEADAGDVLVSSARSASGGWFGDSFDDLRARTLQGVPGGWRLLAAKTH
jgi:hypothetical protein